MRVYAGFDVSRCLDYVGRTEEPRRQGNAINASIEHCAATQGSIEQAVAHGRIGRVTEVRVNRHKLADLALPDPGPYIFQGGQEARPHGLHAEHTFAMSDLDYSSGLMRSRSKRLFTKQ